MATNNEEKMDIRRETCSGGIATIIYKIFCRSRPSTRDRTNLRVSFYLPFTRLWLGEGMYKFNGKLRSLLRTLNVLFYAADMGVRMADISRHGGVNK